MCRVMSQVSAPVTRRCTSSVSRGVSPDARANTDTRSPGAAGSMLTAMSRSWAGWAVPILAARSGLLPEVLARLRALPAPA